jgi:hypothetical protein
MHGLINWSIERFICETYGTPEWESIAVGAKLGISGFERLMTYDDRITTAVLETAAIHLKKPNEAILVDLGTFLCSHPKMEAVRRLLRFGGETFSDFLGSLDDLADRAHLALPGLEIPDISLRLNAPDNVTLRCSGNLPGYGHVLVGVLQAMADDYGTLALIEHMGSNQGVEVVSIQMLNAAHTKGRNFSLATKVS